LTAKTQQRQLIKNGSRKAWGREEEEGAEEEKKEAKKVGEEGAALFLNFNLRAKWSIH